MPLSLRTAHLAGWAPLSLGTVIFIAWLLARRDWLAFAGVMTIWAGLACLLVGTACFARHAFAEYRAPGFSSRLIWRRGIRLGGLYLANFIAGAVYASAAAAIVTCWTVTLVNNTDSPVSHCSVRGGGTEASMGVVEPGMRTTRHLWIQEDGRLQLLGSHRGVQLDEEVIGYVSPGVGRRLEIVLEQDGTVRVKVTEPR